MKSLFFLLGLIFLSCTANLGAQSIVSNHQPSPELQSILKNWKSTSSQALRDPSNASLIQELRSLAADQSSLPQRILLIRVGDSAVVDQCFAQFRSRDLLMIKGAAKQLELAANPDLIARLSLDLNKEESPDLIIKEDIGINPTSVSAAGIIATTIIESHNFPPAVVEWAKHLPSGNLRYRESVRGWWQQNKAALEQGSYQATVVPSIH